MQRNKSLITQENLLKLILDKIDPENGFPPDFDWRKELEKNGYSAELNNIDFNWIKNQLRGNQVPLGFRKLIWSRGILTGLTFTNCQNIPFLQKNKLHNCRFISSTFNESTMSNCKFENCEFNNVTFNQFTLSDSFCKNVTFNQCHFVESDLNTLNAETLHVLNCDFNGTQCANIRGLMEAEYHLNKVDTKSVFVKTGWDKIHDKTAYSKPDERPVVIMLYAPEDGIENASKLIKLYEAYDVNLMLIPLAKGMNHPIFKKPELISGIILPGGPDIPPDDQDKRKKFEIDLLNLACARQIPTLGICRGHQLIGERFGGEIRSVAGHARNQHTLEVKPKESMLYERLAEKYDRFKELEMSGKKKVTTYLNQDEQGKFHYHSICGHYQAVFFKKGQRDKNKIKIVAKAPDGVIEAMQINNHIITYQHHHEAFLEQNPQEGKVAKALLKQYVTLVKEFETAKANKEQMVESNNNNNSFRP